MSLNMNVVKGVAHTKEIRLVSLHRGIINLSHDPIHFSHSLLWMPIHSQIRRYTFGKSCQRKSIDPLEMNKGRGRCMKA